MVLLMKEDPEPKVSTEAGGHMFGLGTTELLIIGGIVVLLFGAKKTPELARGLGRGIKTFKEEMNSEDGASPDSSGGEDNPTGKSSSGS